MSFLTYEELDYSINPNDVVFTPKNVASTGYGSGDGKGGDTR